MRSNREKTLTRWNGFLSRGVSVSSDPAMETSLLALGVSTGSGTLAAAARGVSFDDWELKGTTSASTASANRSIRPLESAFICATHLERQSVGVPINVPIGEQNCARLARAKAARGGSGGDRGSLDARTGGEDGA